MLWLVALIVIPVLAYLFHKATKGTRFGKNCPCAGNVEHLRWKEKSDTPPDGKAPPKLL